MSSSATNDPRHAGSTASRADRPTASSRPAAARPAASTGRTRSAGARPAAHRSATSTPSTVWITPTPILQPGTGQPASDRVHLHQLVFVRLGRLGTTSLVHGPFPGADADAAGAEPFWVNMLPAARIGSTMSCRVPVEAAGTASKAGARGEACASTRSGSVYTTGLAPGPTPGAARGRVSTRASVSLLLVDQGACRADELLGLRAADLLAPGGLLAVLTDLGRDHDGAVVDPTGSVVASAQNADLLYLQHIVIAPAPTGLTSVVTAARRGTDPHSSGHVDLSLFLQPPSTVTALAAGCHPAPAV